MKISALRALQSVFTLTSLRWLLSLGGYLIVNFVYPRTIASVPRTTKLHPTVILRQADNIKIGAHGLLNHGCVIQAGYEAAQVVLGEFVHCGPYVQFFAYDHRFDDLALPSIRQGYREADIIVSDDVWIGAGTVVLAGAFIAKGVVVGANSVVAGRLDVEYGIYVGSPARLVKKRGE